MSLRYLNINELQKTAKNLNIRTRILDEIESIEFINRVLRKFKPVKVTGHLSIGNDFIAIQLDENEFLYSKLLDNSPAYIFFDQEGTDRKSVIVVEHARLIGELMFNSFGMEYFVSNKECDYLIAVNWYGIEVAGTAKDRLKNL